MTVTLKAFQDYFGFSSDAKVVVIDERYNDNDGPFFDAYVLDNDEVHKVTVRHQYHPLYGASSDLISWDLREKANEIYKSKNKDTNKGIYVGCIVKLARSRKAPNGVELEVVGYTQRHFNHRLNRYIDETITVTDGESKWSVSIGCIKEVVKGIGMPTMR